MKKILVFIFFVLVFYGEFQYVDMTPYKTKFKEIEIKGEVKKPGIYQMDPHANTQDVIKQAGGIKKDGDLSTLNLTLDLENHSVIVVGKKQEEFQLISINSATAKQLDTIKGIGPSIAQRIIEYRTLHPFQTLEEIKDVKGIGDKLFEKMKGLITL